MIAPLLVALLATAPDHRPVHLGKRVWIDASLRVGAFVEDSEADIFFLTHHVDLAFPLNGGDVVFGWDLVALLGEDENESGFGNPFLGYTGPVHDYVRLTAGVVLPFIDGDDDDAGEVIVAGLLNANLREPWLWFPDTVSLLLGADVVVPLSKNASFEADVRAVAAFPDEDEPFFVGDVELGFVVSFFHVSAGAVFFDEESILGEGDQARFTGTLGMRIPTVRGRVYLDFQIGLDDTDILDDGVVPSLLMGYAGHF